MTEKCRSDIRCGRKLQHLKRQHSRAIGISLSSSLEYRKGHDPVAMRITTVTSLPSPSPLLLLLVHLLLRLILPGQDAVGAASTCPTPCSCSNQASRVICTRRNLEEVPDSISNNTRYLNLQENSIQVNTDHSILFPSGFGKGCLCVCLFLSFIEYQFH